MATIRPVLGELELSQVQLIDLDGDQVLTRHEVPALEGDFLQRLGRRGARVTLAGYLTGPEAREGLGELRERFRAGQPVSFASDLTSATRLDRVMIESLTVVERAGHPDCFEYDLVLRDYTEAEPVDPVEPPEPPVPPPRLEESGTLVVTVIKENDPDFDAGRVVLTARGEQEDGTPLERPLSEREGNRWTEEDFPVGRYTVEARVPEEELSGTAEAEVRAGETTEVTILLRDESDAALAFLVHFRFDNAFLEPCLRPVLRQVAAFAVANPDRRLLIVGHTDLAGSVQYNQSLSERRARAVYAALRFGNDRPAAIAEWEALRRPRPAGVLPSVNDSWGAREYQQILQDLRFYRGRIDGAHGPATDAAVSAFRVDRGLPPGGTVDDATWAALIEAYLEQDSLSIPDDRFLPNCPGEPLKWLGCSELDPVRDTEDAWRPNRRCEFLFTRATELPADVAQPDTFALAPPVGGGWCLNDSGTTTRCCFTKRYENVTPKETCPASLPRGEPLQRQPGESDAPFVARGTIRFSDGTPYANRRYVLTAPDGEYMDGEQPRTAGGLRGGTPRAGTTDAAGGFAYPDNPKRPGIFILEVQDEVVAFNDGAPLDEAKGAVVCRRLERDGDSFDVIVVPAAAAGVRPSIVIPLPEGVPGVGVDIPPVIVVKRPHTSPRRQPIVLGADQPFTGTGTLRIVQGANRLRIFDAPAGGNELQFDGVDNVFSSDQLAAGVTLFAEGGPDPSQALGDVHLTLQLVVAGQPGFRVFSAMTAVRLTLDITEDRLVPGIDPPVLSEADKANPGRPLQVQNLQNDGRRALLLVRRAEPADFAGDLVLTAINNRVRLFGPAEELPAAGQVFRVLPETFSNTTVPTVAPALQEVGLRFFAEGASASAALRDTGFQLGIAGLEPDGDRVILTTIAFEIVAEATAAAAAVDFIRVGLWDNAFNAGTGALLNGLAEGANFVGSDSRNFFVRAVDPSGGAELSVRWSTLFGDDSDDDVRPAAETITVPQLAGAANTFVSRALMVVTDAVDRAQATNSGLAAPHPNAGNRGLGQSDHRLRRITVSAAHPLDHKVAFQYQPGGFGAGAFGMRATNPLFDRAPEERRRIRVHLVNVRDSAGGTGALTNARRTQVTETIQAIYAVCGIFAEIDEILLDPPASCIGWPTRYTDAIAVDPAVEGFTLPGANLVPSPTQSDLITAVRALASFNASDVYLVFVARIYRPPIPAPTAPPSGGLVAGSRGESFPDAWVAAGAASAGFTFVGVRGGVTDFTEVHEVTHVTTNLRNSAGGHFTLPAADLRDRMNLMRNGTIDTAGVANTKRLWNTDFNNPAVAPPLIPAQIDAIRASRFVRPF